MAHVTLDEAVETGGALLFRLVRSLGVAENNEIRCCGVTPAQSLALLALRPGCCDDGDGQSLTTMRHVTAALGVSPGTATRVIDNLVRDGLVERCDNPADRRNVCIRATAKGGSVIDALEDCYTRFWTMVFEGVPSERLGDTLAALELLVDAADRASAACCSPDNERKTRTKEEVRV
ncbi:MAG: MarR family winged helix-turn-helix transcriptional regulator [Armatimonadota bacterium]